jgi:3-oxoacyl-[acyl-carrier protein] reductase
MNVWVTGASKGIGKSISEALLRENHKVAVSARSRDLLDALSVDTVDSGSVFRVPLDVTSPADVDAAARLINEKFGSIDVLVNNAGVTRFATIQDTSVDVLNEIIDTNLKGTFHAVKSVLPFMLERKSGWIVNIISVTAHRTFTKSGAYAASKAGALAFSNVLREEVRKDGIKVTAVVPGATETEMWPAEIRQRHGGRMMRPDDIGKIIASILKTPENCMLEEVTVRPILGDL